MRVVLIPALIVVSLAVTACEQKPKTAGERVGDAVEELVEPEPKTPTEKAGAAIEEAGEDIKDAAK